MSAEEPETAELLQRVVAGDSQAMGRLLARHRARLQRMVRLRIDPRLAGRVDPSDVVQETLMIASQKIEEFLRDRPLPFYPWLRQLAWNRLVDLHRAHVRAQKRSVRREDPWSSSLLEQSALRLAGRLAKSGASPSGRLLRHEVRQRVRAALDKLGPRDREILVLRHIEELSIGEIAAMLRLTEQATKKRQLRALERLLQHLGTLEGGDP